MRHFRIGALPFLVLMSVTTMQCASNSARIVNTLPAGIPLTDAKHVEIQDGAGHVVLSGEFSNRKAPLVGKDAKSKGLAELEIEKVGTDLKQEIEVAVENLSPSASFKLMVDGKEVATFLTSGAGKRAMKFTRRDRSS